MVNDYFVLSSKYGCGKKVVNRFSANESQSHNVIYISKKNFKSDLLRLKLLVKSIKMFFLTKSIDMIGKVLSSLRQIPVF